MVKGEVILGVNSHVIHVDLKPFFRDHVHADMVHERLEGGGCVGETEEHDCWLIQPKGSDEGCFPLVLFSQSDIVVSPSYVELGKESRVFHIVDKFRNER